MGDYVREPNEGYGSVAYRGRDPEKQLSEGTLFDVGEDFPIDPHGVVVAVASVPMTNTNAGRYCFHIGNGMVLPISSQEYIQWGWFFQDHPTLRLEVEDENV